MHLKHKVYFSQRSLNFTSFHKWFLSKDWEVFDFQQQTWQAFSEVNTGLVNAPIRSGKTYSLWVPILSKYACLLLLNPK